jgi:hypothetical protein
MTRCLYRPNNKALFHGGCDRNQKCKSNDYYPVICPTFIGANRIYEAKCICLMMQIDKNWRDNKNGKTNAPRSDDNKN